MNYNNSHKSHPWHGISLGDNVPDEVRAFIEIVPTDTVKYEVDKESGYLSLDRPQKFSNIVPSLYGFLPRTYCSVRMAELTNTALARYDIEGDGDPLDICVLTEKDVTHGDIIVRARPIGGLRLLDHNQADDKIVAVLKNDPVYGLYNDIEELPLNLFDAVKELEADQYICDTLGKHASSKYIEAKYAEWDEYRRQITNWEIDQYLYKI